MYPVLACREIKVLGQKSNQHPLSTTRSQQPQPPATSRQPPGSSLDPSDPLDLPAYGSNGSNGSAAAAAAAALTELSILESNTRKQPLP